MSESELTELLVDLGLSRLETRIYLALMKLQSEPLTSKAVSEAAEVNRQDTYRVLSDLHNKGIVEKILGSPLKFKGLPLKSGISVLLKQKSNAYFTVKRRSMQALKKCQMPDVSFEPENEVFSLTANLHLVITKLDDEIRKANRSIEMIYSRERMSIISFHLLDELEKALDRGVRAHLITTSACGGEIERNMKALHRTDVRYENFEIRVINEPLNVGLALFDGERCYIRTAESLGHSLFSNNSNIAALSSYFFKSMWEKASPIPILK